MVGKLVAKLGRKRRRLSMVVCEDEVGTCKFLTKLKMRAEIPLLREEFGKRDGIRFVLSI